MRLFLFLSCFWLAACSTPEPLPLADEDVIPTGSRLDFWVFHDDFGWRKSNVFVTMLPRPMTGLEARQWAEGAGARDAGLRWTHYYVLVTPEPPAAPSRSSVYPMTQGSDARAW